MEFAELQEFENMKFKHYSAGMKTRLAFSLSIQIDPDIILVDEVLSVGDFKFREKSLQAFLSFKEKRKTILFATHILAPLPELCDRVLILDQGKMIFLGDPKEAIQTYRKIRED
jgi:ABC-type polysaccharide/polyol phosphate transport system ATPase subunit